MSFLYNVHVWTREQYLLQIEAISRTCQLQSHQSEEAWTGNHYNMQYTL